MTPAEPRTWLLLIHQIPPKPNALRVKIWRRLQQVGAVAIKQSVYVMPLSEQSREDLNWTLKEIAAGGGEGSISEVHFVEGLSDEHILALFRNARQSDYEKLIDEADALLAEWTTGKTDPRDPAAKGQAQLSRLRRRLDEINAIDFFRCPERGTAELRLKALGTLLAGQTAATDTKREGIASMMGKVWVTRANLFIDRLACGWLIRRFVDRAAVFKYVPGSRYTPKPNEVRFDMFDGEFTHVGDRCTFEVMIQSIRIQDEALKSIGEIVHDIDLKDGKFGRSEIDGFNAVLTGLVATYPEDDQRMSEGFRLFDNLYTYFQGHP